MRVALIPYPGSPNGPLSAVEVEVERVGQGSLKLNYRAFGDLTGVRLPDVPEDDPGRTDELWRHTCFEAFLQPFGGEAYFEFNFATSMNWAAYRFDRYREGMLPASAKPWSMSGCIPPRGLELEIEIDPGRFARPDLPAPDWQLGLSAVIEGVDGEKTYWALAHPSDKPDFHHPDSFTLVLPAPEHP